MLVRACMRNGTCNLPLKVLFGCALTGHAASHRTGIVQGSQHFCEAFHGSPAAAMIVRMKIAQRSFPQHVLYRHVQETRHELRREPSRSIDNLNYYIPATHVASHFLWLCPVCFEATENCW